MAEIKRLHYFTGEFLVEKDFTDEQAYHIDMRRRHNRLFHGFGVVDGLVVSRTADRQVQITAGSAIDGQGREVVVGDTLSYLLKGGGTTLYLTLAYEEALLDADRSPQTGVSDFTRWTEQAVLGESATLPPNDGSVIVIARLALKGAGVIDVIDTSDVPIAAVSAIAPGAVREDQIANGSVTDAKIVGMDGAKLTANSVTDAKIVALDGAKLTANSVTDGKIAGMDGAKLTANSVTDGKIASMDGAKLNERSVSATKLIAGTLGFAAFGVSPTPKLNVTAAVPAQIQPGLPGTKDVTLDTTYDSTSPQVLLVSVVPTDPPNITVSWVPTVALVGNKLYTVSYGAGLGIYEFTFPLPQ